MVVTKPRSRIAELPGPRTRSSRRRALAVSGRLSASVDERGTILAFVAEEYGGV